MSCLVGLLGQSMGQVPTAHVRGSVVDYETLKPIPFATVILYEKTELNHLVLDTFMTKERGIFHFDLDTAAMGYKMLCNAPEYFANEIDIVNLMAGDTMKFFVRIELEPPLYPIPTTKKEIKREVRLMRRAYFKSYVYMRREAKKTKKIRYKGFRMMARSARKTIDKK